MGWLRPGIKPLNDRPDTVEGVDGNTYVSGLSAAAQRAELRGDNVLADAIHEDINHELGNR